MSVDLWTYGNHSIPFKGRKMVDPQRVVERLNALHLEDSEFLRDACHQWYAPTEYDSAERIKRDAGYLQQSLQIKSWKLPYEEDYPDVHSAQYYFKGPFGLEIEVLEYSICFSGFVYRYFPWYNSEKWDSKEVFLCWRNHWRSIYRQVVYALGGECVLYYPDNMFKLSEFTPTEKGDLTLDELIQFTRQNYPYCVDTLSGADALIQQNIVEGVPFVVDRFEDLPEDGTLRVK